MSETTSCACGATTATACASGGAEVPAAKKTVKDIQNGKGDAPRNISARFRSNFDEIQWGTPRRGRKMAA